MTNLTQAQIDLIEKEAECAFENSNGKLWPAAVGYMEKSLFKSGAHYVISNPEKFGLVKSSDVERLVDAAEDAKHSLEWPDELNWGKGSIKLLTKALEAFRKEGEG